MKPGIHVLLIAGVVLAQPGLPTLRAQARPDFSGAWTLNADLTERPLQSGGEGGSTMARRTPVGGSGAPVGGGRGPGTLGDNYGGSRDNSDEIARAREAARLAMLIPDRLTIAVDRETIVVTDGEGVAQKLTTDGKPSRSAAGAIKVETRAKWEGATLVVERKFDAGVKITERYSLTAAPRRLTIAAKLENSKLRSNRTRTFQRVYEAQTP
ncbi:MAG TPA: hypothetical protein VFJ02_17075 [Vicinamibacterales bacterium]|nr:hypothetical protein [Vicinamibacterales bacterium]